MLEHHRLTACSKEVWSTDPEHLALLQNDYMVCGSLGLIFRIHISVNGDAPAVQIQCCSEKHAW